MRSVVVVGASLAGLRAADALRRGGFEGRLTIVGDEPHRPYQRPPLSKQLLAGAWERDKIELEVPAGLDAEWMLGSSAVALDPGSGEVTVDTGGRRETLPFDGVVIATGARPRIPGSLGGPAGRPAGVHVLRTVDDCLALRDEVTSSSAVAVAGGGFIGSEVAATCRALGARVALVEPAPTLLHAAVGPRLGEAVTGRHADHGVQLHLGRTVEGMVGDGRVAGVELDDGEVVDADVLVLALGVTPATAWLEGSGLELDDGLVCDSRCRARGVENIVAAGDVARWELDDTGASARIEHFDNAGRQATAAAGALLRGDAADPYRPVPWFWSDQHGMRLQMLGLPRPDDQVAIIEGEEDGAGFVAAYGREGRTTAVVTVDRPARTARYRAAVENGVPFPPPAA